MPRMTIAQLAAEVAALRERLDAKDALTVETGQRLDKHIASSGAVHQDLRGRLAVLEEHMKALLRR